jgi:dihydroorotase
MDVLIEGEKISCIDKNIEVNDDMTIFNGNGYILSPGFIDIHTHVFTGATYLGVQSDDIGVKRGVTSIFDAGSQGPENFKMFLDEVISKSKTSVYSLMNIAKIGLQNGKYEISDLSKIDVDLFREVYHKYEKYIKGMKVRASASTVGELDMEPIVLAKRTAKELNIPMLVHIGNYPPHIDDVLSVLERGDVVTHSFHGKANGIFDDKKIRRSFTDARARGVLFDVGHGSESFNFNVFKRALEEGFYPDIISTDLHNRNLNGPVYSLQETINKIMGLGSNLEECIEKVTSKPAKAFNLTNIGSLKPNYIADLTLFKINHTEKTCKDAENNTISISKGIDIEYVIKNGEFIRQSYVVK